MKFTSIVATTAIFMQGVAPTVAWSTVRGRDLASSETVYTGYVNDDAYPESGCLVVKGEKAVAGRQIILGSCDLNHNWRLDSSGLFHTELKDSMCMQADPGTGKPIVSGVPMRLYPCDTKNKNQQFVLNGVDIRLKGYSGLCVGFRGTTSNVGEDPLILKKCGSNGDNWSEDS